MLMQELYDNLENNIWYNYFWNIYDKGKMKGINWIDLESEISHIIKKIDCFQENLDLTFNIKCDADDKKMGIFLEQIQHVWKELSTYRECVKLFL